MAMFVPQAQQQPFAAMVGGVQPAPELPPGQILPGKVKAWMEEKGFGFITPDNGGPDVFVHRNQLSDGQSLVAGAQVTFECRLNVARGKYEATTCTGAAGSPSGVPALADMTKGMLGGKGGGSQDNLFVAGLPLGSTEEAVRDMFSQYGVVQQCKILPDTPGKTDRAALVRFGDETQAKWMVENLNGRTLPGLAMPLTVRFAGDRPGQPAAVYGKALGGVTDPRFSPYGAVAGIAQAAAAANPQLSDATLAAALVQLLPGVSQQGGAQPVQGLQTAQVSSVPGMQVGLAPQDTSMQVNQMAGQLAAGQQVGVQQVGVQQLGGQPMAGQQVVGQAMPGQQVVGQAMPGQQIASQPMGGQVMGGQVLAGQTMPGQAVAGQVFAPQAVGSTALAGGQPVAAAPVQQLGVQPGQLVGAAVAPAASDPAAAAAGQTAVAAAFTAPAAAAVPAAAVSPMAAVAGTQPTAGAAPVAATAATAGVAGAVAAAPAPAPAPAPPAAGGQWLEATDPASGRPYYYHAVTREVRWDKPAE